MAFTVGGRFLAGTASASGQHCLLRRALREAGRWSWRRCSRDVAVLACIP